MLHILGGLLFEVYTKADIHAPSRRLRGQSDEGSNFSFFRRLLVLATPGLVYRTQPNAALSSLFQK
jgi:hypothetical protein